MASHITHIVQGKKIFDRLPSNLNWNEFVIGTIFPDIRYLAHKDRDLTHIYNTSAKEIPTDNSFKAGLYVHCFIDERRVQLLKELGMMEFIDYNWINESALKLVEDVVLFDKIQNWEEILTILALILPEETEYGISKEIVRKWHADIQRYIKESPSPKYWKENFAGIPAERALPIIQRAEEFMEIDKLKSMLLQLYEKI